MLVLHFIRCQHNLGAWCSGAVIVFTRFFKKMGVIINCDICIYYVFGVWYGYGLSFNYISSCIFYRRFFTIICLCAYLFFTYYINVFIELIMTIWSGWSFVWRFFVDALLLPVLFFKFFLSANFVGHGWWVMIFCCIFQNYEVLKIC